MRRGFKLVWLAIAVTGLALGLAACGDDDDDGGGGGEETLDLVIGDSLPLTGDLADFGPPGEKAADLAARRDQRAIEEAGVDHTVEVIHEDNAGGADQQAAVQSARKLVESDGASCIAGAWASDDTIPIAESVAIPEGVLLISPASTSDEITGLEDDGLVNRTSPPDAFQGPTLCSTSSRRHSAAPRGTRSTSVRATTPTAPGSLTRSAQPGRRPEARSARRSSMTPPSRTTTRRPSRSSRATPTRVLIIDFPETYNKVGPALVRAGFDPESTFVTDGLISGDLADSAGEEAVEGLRGTAPGVPDDDEASQAFDELYTNAEPKDVERQTFDAQNFDAVVLCYLAAVAAGSTEGQEMADALGDVSGPARR